MKEKRILYVSSEVVPYLAENEVSLMSYDVPKMINDQGGQIRIFMPRYGNINERRHQLHEVIRLSGMNLVVNDLDMPLIIKVASIPKERIQVYFIDNDEYFKRKATFADEEGVLYPDNDERAIFFAKGVVETVKKLNWVPDIIHVHGWLAGMLPERRPNDRCQELRCDSDHGCANGFSPFLSRLLFFLLTKKSSRAVVAAMPIATLLVSDWAVRFGG
jgi:starch synthase